MVKWLESTYDGLEQSGRSIHIMVAKHGASGYLPTLKTCAIKIAQFCSSISNYIYVYIYIYTMPYFEHMGYIYIYNPRTGQRTSPPRSSRPKPDLHGPLGTLNTAWAGCQGLIWHEILQTRT